MRRGARTAPGAYHLGWPPTGAPSPSAPGGSQLNTLRRIASRMAGPGWLGGVHPLLFAAYPVLFLWSQNLGEVPPEDVAQPLVLVVGIAALVTLGLAIVFGVRARSALIVTPAIFGVLVYGHVFKLTGLPTEVLVGFWVLVVWLAFLAAWRFPLERVLRVDRALLAVGALFVGVSLVSIVPYEVDEAMAAPPPVLVGGRTLPSETAAQKRDVYWLVYDRYGSDRALKNLFNVDNDLTPWLRDKGFEVLENSHANYVATSLSMSTTMNLAHLEELTGLVGSSTNSYNAVYRRLQSSLVPRQFQALGYRYLHLGSWWNPTRFDEAADRNYNADGVNDFTSVLFTTSGLPLAVEGARPRGAAAVRAHQAHQAQHVRARPARPAARRARPEVRPRPHPPAAPAVRVRQRRPADDRGGGQGGSTTRRPVAASLPTRIRASARSSRASSRCPRTSSRSSSCRPTRARGPIRTSRTRSTTTGTRPRPRSSRRSSGSSTRGTCRAAPTTCTCATTRPRSTPSRCCSAATSASTATRSCPTSCARRGGWNRPYQLIDITDKLPSLPGTLAAPSAQRRRSRKSVRGLSAIGSSRTTSNRSPAAARNPSSV